jgi:hypothetical protein
MYLYIYIANKCVYIPTYIYIYSSEICVYVCVSSYYYMCLFSFFKLSLDITKLAFIQLRPQATVCVLILLCVFFLFVYLT